jgi:lysophospholipase L1-like esterase
MPDIVATVISPDQLSPRGELPAIDIERFAKRCLAQGDSWFSIGGIPPWATTNLLSQMVFSQSACIVNCAMPGKELAHMFDSTRQRRFLQLLRGRLAWQWNAIFLSGGGNDLIDATLSPPTAPQANRLLLTSAEWDASSPVATRYLSAPGWATFTMHLNAVLDQFLAERARGPNQVTPVLMHSYDVAVPRNAGAGLGFGPWLHKAFETYAIPPDDRTDVAVALLTALRDLLAAMLAARAGNQLFLIDTIGTLARASRDSTGESGDWENEIHPTPHGYNLLARRWRPEVEARW